MISTEPTAGRGALQSWSSIDWPAVERNVRRLQERIFRASQNGEPAKVRNLQKLLVRSARQQWGKLTDDELDQVEGRREELVGRIQEKYGIARGEAERQVRDWQGTR